MTKPTTLQDVARALQMHKSTVSLALSGKGTIAAHTRLRVFEAARDMGYEPDPVAQRLAHGYNRSTVCLFSGVLDVGLTTEKILLVQRALAAHGLDVPIYTCGGLPSTLPGEEAEIGGKSLAIPAPDENDGVSNGENQAAQVRQLCRQRPRAILCAAQRVHPAVFRELETFQKSGGLVVSYDTPTPLECDQVVFDREDNAYRATRFLLEQGHRHIGIGMSRVPGGDSGSIGGNGNSGGSSDDKISDPQHHRRRGFTRALREAGITPRADWFFNNATYEKGGAEMARAFLALRERPTAVAVVNDYVALAFMSEVMRAGVRIPQDLSVIGHDDQPIAAYCPVPLTCMTQPVDEIAQSVADLLLDRMQNRVADDAPPRSVVIRSGFVERASVAPPLVSDAH